MLKEIRRIIHFHPIYLNYWGKSRLKPSVNTQLRIYFIQFS